MSRLPVHVKTSTRLYNRGGHLYLPVAAAEMIRPVRDFLRSRAARTPLGRSMEQYTKEIKQAMDMITIMAQGSFSKADFREPVAQVRYVNERAIRGRLDGVTALHDIAAPVLYPYDDGSAVQMGLMDILANDRSYVFQAHARRNKTDYNIEADRVSLGLFKRYRDWSREHNDFYNSTCRAYVAEYENAGVDDPEPRAEILYRAAKTRVAILDI